MYEISSNLYLKIAEAMMSQIGLRDYFSGVVYYTAGDVECRLLVTLFVERATDIEEGSTYRRVSDLIPVWWEFSTIEGGVELLNDFSFNTLRNTILG